MSCLALRCSPELACPYFKLNHLCSTTPSTLSIPICAWRCLTCRNRINSSSKFDTPCCVASISHHAWRFEQCLPEHQAILHSLFRTCLYIESRILQEHSRKESRLLWTRRMLIAGGRLRCHATLTLTHVHCITRAPLSLAAFHPATYHSPICRPLLDARGRTAASGV
jgi:hypothetical protein